MTTLDLLSTAEVAEKAKVDVSTVTRWVKAGDLEPVYKARGVRGNMLFDPKAVDEYLNNRK